MNAKRVSTEAVLAMWRIAAFIANMISAGGCASAGFAEAGALVPPTPVGGAPLFGFIPYSLDLPYRDNAIAISARSAHANENPSAVTPKTTGPPAKDVITANTKPKTER